MRILVITGFLVSIGGCADPAPGEPAAPAQAGRSDTIENDAEAEPAAEDEENNQSGRTYGGYTLAQWKHRFKTLEPESREAAGAVGGLVELIGDSELPWFTRRQGALLLAAIGPPADEAVPVLVRLLKEEGERDEQTRLWAAKALGGFGREARQAVPFLVELLKDPARPTAVRQAAIEALSSIGAAHPESIPALVAILEDRAGEERAAAGRQQQQDIVMLRGYCADGIGLIGPAADSAVPALIRATRDEHETIRRKAAAALGGMGPRGAIAIEALIERLVLDESPAVRDAAAVSLAGIGPQAVDWLVKLLEHPEAGLRERAAESLGRIGRGAREAVPALESRLEDEDPGVRISACEALWAITGRAEPILTALIEALTSEDRNIRLRAYRQITGLGNQSQAAVGPLEELLQHERGYVRSVARRALEEIGE